jgi:hypothetical protein
MRGEENLCNWINLSRKEWDEHTTRMQGKAAVKIARDTLPTGRRCPGRPHRKWRDDINLT